MKGSIGVFDSGLGGLTVLDSLQNHLPDYNYIYLGDNARAPYGTRSFDTILKYTIDSVQWLFQQGCPLIILACNTASARALRSIQQNWLPLNFPNQRVLGVIRPMTEFIRDQTKGDIGILATSGTVRSQSYLIELSHFIPPNRKITQEACPLWVPLIENGELNNIGSDYFIQKHIEHLLNQNANIENIILGCTHYPYLKKQIAAFLPSNIQLLEHGPIVANKLLKYLMDHPEIEIQIKKEKHVIYKSTEEAKFISEKASFFLNKSITFEQIELK